MNRKCLKGIIVFTITGLSLLALPIRANAEWKQDSAGWWYSEGNSYSTGWRLINGSWYYFYPNGYMARDTTIDGYYLNSNGAWVLIPSHEDANKKQLFYINRGYEKNNKKYIEGYFEKFVTDLNEAREYEKRTGNQVICHDDTGDYIPDDGFDMPTSDITTLEVADNIQISKVDFDAKGNILNINKDFNSIISDKYKSRPVFQITIENGVVTKLNQEYRP